MDLFTKNEDKLRIVVAGTGFGGIELAKHIHTEKFETLLLDRNNYFTFQPLLYQVATGGLEPDSIAFPIRKIFNAAKKISFRVAEVKSIQPERNTVSTSIGEIPFDFLVIATGSMTNFFGMESTERNSLSLKSVPDALDMRSFILQNFESALQSSGTERDQLMNMVVVGGGPTGVEIAGALAELKRHVLPNDYPELDLSRMQISLVEAADRILAGMSEASSNDAKNQLEESGVRIVLNSQLTNYDGEKAVFKDGTIMETKSLIWTAGVKGNIPSGFGTTQLSRGNRLPVDAFQRVNGYENIFAIGDAAALAGIGGIPYPMLAPVAVQQGRNLARNLGMSSSARWKPFHYSDKGTMATIGRSKAVADLKFIHLKGFMAWMAWLFIHLMLLVGFRNRVIVFINWMWNYLSYDRAIRLIIRPYKRQEKNS